MATFPVSISTLTNPGSRPAARPLLPRSARLPAAALVAACAVSTALLAAGPGHSRHTDRVDAVLDARLRAGLAGHHTLLEVLARPGDLAPVAAITTALALTCLLRRRYRGALLLAIAIPAAAVITERLLKPLVGRTALGFLSFPSGHATGTFALATAITVLLAGAPQIPRAVRLAIAVIGFAAAAVVAAAMIALGFHYFTDTVAGAAVGTGTVLATALVLDLLMLAWWRSHEPPPPAGAEDGSRPVGAKGTRWHRADARQG